MSNLDFFEKEGYRIVVGEDKFNHFFGGESWNIPYCPQCHEKIHQIITLDLRDDRLNILKGSQTNNLPLISCLNCSLVWDEQIFKLDVKNNTIKIIKQNSTFEWKNEPEDMLPIPLPELSVKLEGFKKEDNPINEQEYEIALGLLGKEYFCRLLGTPLILENELDIICPNCKKKMIYIATLSGEDYDNDPQLIQKIHFNFGELLIYFSFCTDCSIIKTESQVI